MDIESLVVFQELLVGPVIIEKDKIYAQYKITKETGDSQANKLIFKYQETVFSPTLPESQNIASMVCVQVAINYGLFFRNIVFDGLFDDIDKRFIISMVENTSREIYVNKLLFPNEFIRNEFLPVTLTNKKKYTASKITFINTRF
ncbi:MAG: creatininase family protein, partial [Chitinispirillia bacterium]